MNKKGQVLVVFILILPILILLMMLIYEIGNIGFIKKQAESSIKDAMIYGLNNIEKEDVLDDIDTILSNTIKNINKKDININNDKINIELTIKVEGNFKGIFDNNLYLIKLKYIGYKENDQIRIKEW